jgi:hypothetical protein
MKVKIVRCRVTSANRLIILQGIPGRAPSRAQTFSHSFRHDALSLLCCSIRYVNMSRFFNLALVLLMVPIAAYTNPKDALINPRGKKVCMQQCGTSALQCPEAFVSFACLN